MRFAHFIASVTLLLFCYQSAASTPLRHPEKRTITPRDPVSGTLQLWSAFNSDLVDHVYSTNSTEIDYLKDFYGFSDEGTLTGYLHAEPQPSTVPLFRLYAIGLSDHLYTTSTEVRDHAVKRLGYTVVETVGYLYQSGGPGRVPLYQLHNRGAHDHFYTTSADQRDDAARNGWVDEGAVGYVFPL